MSERVFLHCGDIGDVIASLPTVKAMGGGHYRITYRDGGQRENMFGARFDAIRPLLEVQPYIKSVEWTWNSSHTLDLSNFRTQYRLHDNLAEQHARYAGVTVELQSPWLSVSSPIPHGVAVIARSPRYHNPIFPWRKILEAYPDRIFVGLQQEHREFEASFGEISYYPTKDLLELARVIAGASQVISNQTASWWIASGLGMPTIQETMQFDQNSIIERSNLQYTRDVSEVNALIQSLQIHSQRPNVQSTKPLMVSV